MDRVSITIIVIATLSALLFKFVLYKKICHWMDQDLVKDLANGDPDKLLFLTSQHQRLKADKVKRKDLHQRLTDFAEQFEHNR